jgi:hypothetical protein
MVLVGSGEQSRRERLTRGWVRRYFPYWITVAALTIIFIFLKLWLISQRQLLPGIVIMGSFILFILWTVGLIVISIELWGPTGSVNSTCQLYVQAQASTGSSLNTLAYLEQHSICEFGNAMLCGGRARLAGEANFAIGQSWTAAWAFELVGVVFLLWMMIMAYQVYSGE